MVDELPTFVLEDGTIIDTNKIGYVANSYGVFDEDLFYEKFTKNDISFIVENNIECHIEVIDEFTDTKEYIGTAEGFRKPKLYKGKVIIHYS